MQKRETFARTASMLRGGAGRMPSRVLVICNQKRGDKRGDEWRKAWHR